MQYRSIFRDVDSLPAKHRFDASPEIAFFGQIDQKTNRLIRDAILRVVEVKAGSLDDEPFATLWIIAEELPQMDIPYRPVVLFQRLPCDPDHLVAVAFDATEINILDRIVRPRHGPGAARTVDFDFLQRAVERLLVAEAAPDRGEAARK